MLRRFAALAFFSAASVAFAQAPSAAPAASAAGTATRDANLPPSKEQAKAALDKSPRHGEYVDVKMPWGEARIELARPSHVPLA